MVSIPGSALLASGAGRAVAAGGDVHGMVGAIADGRPEDSEFYLRCEYQFYYLMNTNPLPSVTLMPGIVMGGGLGFCQSLEKLHFFTINLVNI